MITELESVICLACISVVSAILPYGEFQEGPCQTHKDVNFLPVFNVRRQLLNSLPYIPAGNKYTLHRLAYNHPQSSHMSDDELQKSFCLTRNTSSEHPVAANFGFGLTLQTYSTKVRVDLPGSYLDLIPLDSDWDILRQYVTLTDDKNYAVIYNCWTRDNQRGWMVISRTPKLDFRIREIIEKHVMSLGFLKADIVFLKNDQCLRVDTPFLPGDLVSSVTEAPPTHSKVFRSTHYRKRSRLANSVATTSSSTDVIGEVGKHHHHHSHHYHNPDHFNGWDLNNIFNIIKDTYTKLIRQIIYYKLI